MRNSNIAITVWTLLFGWYKVKYGSKNEHQKYTFLKKFKVYAQNMLIILISMVNIIGRDLGDHLIRKRIFTLTLEN